MHPLQEFEKAQMRTNLPDFKVGDTLRVYCKVKEGDKERIQLYEGVVIARHNNGVSSSITVRKVSYGIGVERIFPLHAPFIDRIEVASVGRVRRAKLYYLRKLSGKKARIFAEERAELGAAVPVGQPQAPSEAIPPTTEPPTEK